MFARDVKHFALNCAPFGHPSCLHIAYSTLYISNKRGYLTSKDHLGLDNIVPSLTRSKDKTRYEIRHYGSVASRGRWCWGGGFVERGGRNGGDGPRRWGGGAGLACYCLNCCENEKQLVYDFYANHLAHHGPWDSQRPWGNQRYKRAPPQSITVRW
jgi:hypothetical protein